VTHDAHIGELLRLEREQQASDARTVDFHAEVIALRMSFGERRQMIPVAKADFDDPRGAPPKERIQIQRLRCEGNAEPWP
jgi:hypothetical protein